MKIQACGLRSFPTLRYTSGRLATSKSQIQLLDRSKAIKIASSTFTMPNLGTTGYTRIAHSPLTLLIEMPNSVDVEKRPASRHITRKWHGCVFTTAADTKDRVDLHKPFRSVDRTWNADPESNSCTLLERLRKDVQAGPRIERCPWLGRLHNDELARENYPVFLWDICQGKTMLVDRMGELPRYTAVSHTWGRWRLEEEASGKVEGVPWLVPKNSRFQVEDLPQSLRNASLTTSHV